MTRPDGATPRGAPPRRLGLWTGLFLLALCLVVPVYLYAAGPVGWNLRFVRGLSWTWELPGPLPYVVILLYPSAALLLLPDLSALGRRHKLLVGALVLTGVPVLGFAGLIGGGFVAVRLQSNLDYRIVHLEDPGFYERAVIEASGRTQLSAGLWAVRPKGDGFEFVSEPYDYPPCDWPFEVRKSPHGPRYLIVDSGLRACAVLDLTEECRHFMDYWQVLHWLPPFEELRREFGEDISAPEWWED